MSATSPMRELLPYLYIAAGVLLLLASWLVRMAILSYALLALGALSLGAGIMVWLHRKEHRAYNSEYTGRPLDD